MASFSGTLQIDAGSITGNKLASNAEILRSQLKQVTGNMVRITPFEWRVWNSGALLTTAGTDDLGLVAGTFGTNVFTVQAGDLKAAGATTRYAIAHVYLPDHYDANETVEIRLTAGMQTTIADVTCTIDVEAYKVDDDGTPTADGDLCTTAAQSINSLTAADKDFTLDATSTSFAAGDLIELRIAIACNDGATATAVTPVLYKAALLFDARG